MKRYLLVIITLFCALTVSAVRYASPYTGSGRNYGIYTSYSAYKAEAGSLAQAPVASMSSVNSSRGISSSNVSLTRVQSGIYTSASSISGGVTTYDTGHHHPGHIRRAGEDHPGGEECEHCVDGDGNGVCDVCGEDMDNCECEDCHCPLTDGWQVWLMVALLAAGYAVRRNRKITQ